MNGVNSPIVVPYGKWILIIFLTVIYLESDCDGTNVNLDNTETLSQKIWIDNGRLENQATSSVLGRKAPKTSKIKSSFRVVTSLHLILAAVSIVISNLFLFIILDYLNNLALAKECILLFLYKDLMKLGMTINSLEMICFILSYSIENWTGLLIIGAKIMSFITWSVFGLLLLLMNIVSALHLYINKANILDPPMPWGDDDKRGMKYIRSICTTLTITFTLTMHVIGLYPKIYYWIVSQGPDTEPKMVIIYPMVLTSLIFSSSVTSLVAKFYKSSSLPLADAALPQQINYIYTILFMSLTVSVLLRLFDVLDSSDIWMLWQFNVDIVQIVTPLIIIVRTIQLKDYTYNFMKTKFEDLFFLKIYSTPLLICVFMYSTLCVTYNLFDI